MPLIARVEYTLDWIEHAIGWVVIAFTAYILLGVAIVEWGWSALWKVPKCIALCIFVTTVSGLLASVIFGFPLGALYYLIVKTPQMP